MEKKIVIPDNVMRFLRSTAIDVGDFRKRIFFEHTKKLIGRVCVESPIEQILYVALIAVAQFKYVTDDITIECQEKIGKYRIDFMVEISGGNPVFIECDGHEFHDKDQKQRDYEKARDRYFTKKGLKVFHYTGKNITDAPYVVATEIIDYLMLEVNNG